MSAALQQKCDEFNTRHRPGSYVRYWPTSRREGAGELLEIASAGAQVLSGHTAVLWLVGKGSVALSHIEPIDDKGAEAWAHIEILRAEEGDSVHVFCDNPDGPCAVEVCGHWTEWENKRVEGETVFDALRNAVAMRNGAKQ